MINEIKLEIASDSNEALDLALKLLLSNSNIVGYYFSEIGELCFCSSAQLSCSLFITPPSLESLKLMILDWLKKTEYPLPQCGGDDMLKPGWFLVRDDACIGNAIFRVSPSWIFYGK